MPQGSRCNGYKDATRITYTAQGTPQSFALFTLSSFQQKKINLFSTCFELVFKLFSPSFFLQFFYDNDVNDDNGVNDDNDDNEDYLSEVYPAQGKQQDWLCTKLLLSSQSQPTPERDDDDHHHGHEHGKGYECCYHENKNAHDHAHDCTNNAKEYQNVQCCFRILPTYGHEHRKISSGL